MCQLLSKYLDLASNQSDNKIENINCIDHKEKITENCQEIVYLYH